MSEKVKIQIDLLKTELDLLKQFFTTLIVLNAGVIGFLFLNYEVNSFSANICVIGVIAALSAIFIALLIHSIIILNTMKGLVK